MTRSALALALALAVSPSSALAYCRTTTSAAQPDPTRCPTVGEPVAWATGCTSLRINPTVLAPGISLAQFHSAVEDSIQAWKVVACNATTRAAPSFELVLLPDADLDVGYEQNGANSNVVTFRATWENDAYHPSNAAAITVVTFGSRTGAILDADTEFNVVGRYPFSYDGGPATTDLRTVATHEFGHTQGLAHSADRAAVMWYTAGQGERRRTPNADDVAGICAVYPPGRAVRCDPELREQALEGGGATCTASRPSTRRPAGVVSVVAAAVVAAAIARRFVARRRTS